MAKKKSFLTFKFLMTTKPVHDPEAAPAETRKVDTFSFRAVIWLHTAAITFFVLWNVVGHRKYCVFQASGVLQLLLVA